MLSSCRAPATPSSRAAPQAAGASSSSRGVTDALLGSVVAAVSTEPLLWEASPPLPAALLGACAAPEGASAAAPAASPLAKSAEKFSARGSVPGADEAAGGAALAAA